ncbi:pectinesterase family protein [Persicobacter diffluens]|uniref:Pectinesterase n=1 Tax=Persicobacter diffluens TaxID=981 RepID=A0AAN4W1U1_9BACT|nr:hypothetical protein PEDI_47960 [Persicobacter diffluens]
MKISKLASIFFCLLTFQAYGQAYDFIVDGKGSGDFETIQAAIDQVPVFRKKETSIFIKNGVYKEKLTIPQNRENITLIGESSEKTVISFDDFASKKNRFGENLGTSGSSSVYIYANDFTAKSLTFENSFGAGSQAVAVLVSGDRVIFDNCRFLGFQDTLYPKKEGSRQYYKNCYIEGATDFIFGWATAVFEDCEIFSRKGGKYITAASTNKADDFGFVFINCKLTSDAPDQSVYLGRPWRPDAKTVYLSCEFGQHIHPEGWHNWNKPEREQTAFYAEFNCFGPGAGDQQRVKWSHKLSSREMVFYRFKYIFDDWVPNTESVLFKSNTN